MVADTDKKTFLLGLGAQKAGTTWVYKYLREHPECEMGEIKEKAVFSAYFNTHDTKKRSLKKIEILQKELGRFQWRLNQDKDKAERIQYLLDLMDNLAAEHDLRYYLSYFDRLLDQNPAAKLVGEITPVYSNLTADNLKEIKALLEGAGYDVKVLFLMRDPIERCYSAMRMGARRDMRAGKDDAAGAHESFADRAVMDWCQIRTCYERIVPGIETVFAPQDVMVDLYETFFTTDKIRALCDFLGISYVDADVDSRVNISPREEEPDAAQLAAVRRFYDPTYAFVADRLGEERIAAVWPHYNRSF